MTYMRGLNLITSISLLTVASPLTAQRVCPATTTLVREIGYDDNADPLDGVRAVAIDGAGRAIIAESDGNSLKVFGPDGGFVGRWGRTGEGPGEFRSVLTLLSMRDSVWVFDNRLRRGTFMRGSGTPGRVVNLRQNLPGSETFGEAYPLGSHYVVLPGLSAAALATDEGQRRRIFILTSDGTSPPSELAPPVVMRSVLLR